MTLPQHQNPEISINTRNPVPKPQSQSFLQNYGSTFADVPCSIEMTRGYKPWRPIPPFGAYRLSAPIAYRLPPFGAYRLSAPSPAPYLLTLLYRPDTMTPVPYSQAFFSRSYGSTEASQLGDIPPFGAYPLTHTVLYPPEARTPVPKPQSQSFSRSFGSTLPISLIYFAQSTKDHQTTRGYKP